MLVGLDILIVVIIVFLGYKYIYNDYIWVLSWSLVYIVLCIERNKGIDVCIDIYICNIEGILLGYLLGYNCDVIWLILLLWIISIIVLLYSIYYMDLHLYRDLCIYICIFVCSMCIFISSKNIYSLLIGYEFLGIISFVLINYYIYRIENIRSSINCMIMNKLGDILLFISLLGLDYSVLSISYMMLLLFMSSMFKSSQIPFNNWLLLAMNAPTPISSLLHSSTLVIGGILLLLKLKAYIYLDLWLYLYIGIGSIWLCSILGILEYDIKRIIALSTNSQLGYIYVLLGYKSKNLVIYYIICHGLLKCLLFMCSGLLIHINLYVQDIRILKNRKKDTDKLVYLTLLICILGMCGCVGLCLYYSKEELLSIQSIYLYDNLYIFYYLYIGLTFSMLYNIRLFIYLV